MQLEFAQAMSDFKTMFPEMDKEVIEAVLRANQGAVDATIDQLLAMSTDNQVMFAMAILVLILHWGAITFRTNAYETNWINQNMVAMLCNNQQWPILLMIQMDRICRRCTQLQLPWPQAHLQKSRNTL